MDIYTKPNFNTAMGKANTIEFSVAYSFLMEKLCEIVYLIVAIRVSQL